MVDGDAVEITDGPVTAPPATTLMADRWLKSCSVAALPDGSVCRDSREPASSPCSACTVPVHGPASPSVAARCRRDGLVRVAAKAFHFEIAEPGVDRVTQRRRRLRRSLKAEHALIPCLDREPIGLLARFRRPLCRRPNRRAVDCLSRFASHAGEDAPGRAGQASRYRLRWLMRRLPALADQAAGQEIAQHWPLTGRVEMFQLDHCRLA